MELAGRVIIALTVVVGLIYLIGKRARGGVRRKLRTAKLIDVLGRQTLAKGSSVAVVRVAGRAMIVGVTDQNVRMLGEIDLDEVAAAVAESDANARRTAAPAAIDPLTVPADAAELDGMLTTADIAALRDAAKGTVPEPSLTLRRAQPPHHLPTAVREHRGLTGSALSPATWRQTLDALRELTVRKG